ncbi:MAG TPA: class II glutamine amidotransferase [Armatimonadota bacterium]|nr:class II glutamine amidotransferase [Armatimonadota bacterium]
MCGIGGLLLNRPGDIGHLLVQMLDGCQHRGPDSTGFALYHTANGSALICRAYLGCAEDSPEAPALEQSVLAVMAEHGARIIGTRHEAEYLRVEFDYDDDLKGLSYALTNDAAVEVFSIGNRLEVIKDVGTAAEVDGKYGISTFEGTHGIGHVRLATESVVNVRGSHPFWAYGFNDVAIVHNGQITNYFKMKRRLIKRGFQFRTENDSELIAVYLADKMASGSALDGALEDSVKELDGTFSFLVSTSDAIGFAKDTLAAKPMVVLERDDAVAVASEEVSLQRLFPGERLSTYEPFPGTFKTWSRSTLETRA